jgi:hypothetical protein
MPTHHTIQSYRKVVSASERSFGLAFAAIFSFYALWPLVRAEAPRWWALALAGAFLAAAFLQPQLLRPLNRMWFRLGLLLHHVTNPLIMGAVFYLVVTPIGLLMRALKKDLLRLKLDPAAKSYWIVREPPAPKPQSMSKQF